MSVWLFQDNGSAVKFTTSGATMDLGVYTINGPNWFGAPGSYYANGSHRFHLGATRGLINRAQLGTVNNTATAKTVVFNNPTSVGLSSAGVTGTFSIKMIHPESFGFSGTWFNVCAPKYTNVQIKIRNGIIYGWKDSIGYQILNQWGYVGPVTTSTEMNVETGAGVGVTSNTTSLRIVAGLSGTLTYYAAYDIYLYDSGYYRIYYNKFIITLSSGLLVAMTTTTSSLYYRTFAELPAVPSSLPGTGNTLSFV